MIKTDVELISPARARKYLEANTNNPRNLNRNWVVELRDIIARGEWSTTHQGIAFNTDGELEDGQHRLAAIAEAGKSVRVLVTRGLAPSVRAAVDSGHKRSMSVRTGLTARMTALAMYHLDLFTAPATPTTVKDTADRIEAYAAPILKIRAAKRPPAVPIVYAAALHMASNDPEQQAYTLEQYAAYAQLEYATMTRATSAFTKRLAVTSAEKTIGARKTRLEVGARAYNMLFATRKNATKTLMTLTEMETALLEAAMERFS